MGDNTASKKYKLYYFDALGLAEPIRYLLSYCGIPFEDVRMDYVKEWLPKYKSEMPMEQVPVLEIDGVKYHQHLAICRYIAKQNNLLGSSDEEACEIDAFVEDINDIRIKVGKWFHEQDAALKMSMRLNLVPDLMFYLGRFEAQVKANKGFFVGTKVSWVDIYYAAIIEMMSKLLKEDLNKQQDYPNLRDLGSRVRSHIMITPYIQNRPVTEY